MRKALIGFAIVSLVVGVALLAVSLSQSPTALAQETETESFFQPLEDVLDELVEEEVITEEQRDRIADEFQEKMVHFGEVRRGIPHLETAARVLDIEIDDLAEQLRDGATIADIAGDQTQEVIDALIAEHSYRIDDAVAGDRISEERAEELRSALAEKVEALVHGERPMNGAPWNRFHGPQGFDFFKGPRGHERFGFGGAFGFDSIAGALGLEADELKERLAGGSSLLDIAGEQGVSVKDVVDAVLIDVDEHLANLVAGERMTQQRADALRERIAEGIESLLTAEFPPFGEGMPGFPDRRFPFPKDFLGFKEFDGFLRFHEHHQWWHPDGDRTGVAGTGPAT